MTTTIQHIDLVPGRCGGKPCIVGTRIRVYDIYVWHLLRGQSVEQIVSEFPQLSLADVYAALAYFHDHREVILTQMKEDDEFAAGLQANQPPSKLRRYLDGEASTDAISP